VTEPFDLTCQVTIGLLPAYLDDDLPDRQAVRLEQHLVTCPGCLTYLAQLRRTIAAVAGLRLEWDRERVWDRIAATLAGTSAPVPGADADPGTSGLVPNPPTVAFKFLRADRVSPFAGVRWPEPGHGWVRADARPGPCRRAVHACRVRDLAYWVDQTLWRVELAGDVAETPSKIVAERGRLVERVAGWPAVAGGFVADCAARIGQLLNQARERGDTRSVHFLTAYAEEVAQDKDPASVSYVAAHAAGVVGWTAEEALTAASAGVDNPFDQERHRQSGWLADRLGLRPTGEATGEPATTPG
jgi:Putative zinc-finger